MSSSLGLYIEDNLIKYAKVSKNNDIIKVESFGIKFYEKIEEAIKQIVEETYSYKIPISVNLAEEKYNYFDVFEGLKKKDGYCPCRIPKTPENKCMCKEFRDQIADPNWYGFCHCLLYEKIKTDEDI